MVFSILGEKVVLLLNSFLSELVVAYFIPKISTGMTPNQTAATARMSLRS